MKLRMRLISIVVAVAAVAALAAGPASANRSFSTVGGGRAIGGISSAGGLTFRGDNGMDIITNATLNGSLHPAVSKSGGSLLGTITRAQFGGCRMNVGIACTIGALPPIHTRFQSFSGTLPRITGTTVRFEFAHSVDMERLRCLYTGTLDGVSGGRTGAAEYTIESQQIGVGNRSSLFRAEGEEFFRRCPQSGEIMGSLTSSPAVTIRLQ